jgi:hypothetical protein
MLLIRRKRECGMKVDEALVLLGRLEKAMKAPEFEAALNSQKLNSSFALLAIEALQAYLQGDAEAAQSDFATLANELNARRELGHPGSSTPSS